MQSTWPFWAPSGAALVDQALDLAGLRPGERFMDLGCGDGRTLERAARRGASVAGVDGDATLVEQAARRLAGAGIDPGGVQVGDIFATPLDADVLFTYLAPATLQQLAPRLQATAPGTRLVAVDFPVPGLAPAEQRPGLFLYRLPAGVRGANGHVGWASAGVLAVVPPGCQSLTVLELHHPGGAVAVSVTGRLAGAVTVATGAGHAAPRQPVAVDVRWEAAPLGTLVHGQLRVTGVRPLTVIALVARDEDGLWELDDGACRAILRRCREAPPPTSLDQLMAALA